MKKDLPIIPENLLKAAKESLPQRNTDVLSCEERDELLIRVNTNIAASLANPKSLEKCLFKMKKKSCSWGRWSFR